MLVSEKGKKGLLYQSLKKYCLNKMHAKKWHNYSYENKI